MLQAATRRALAARAVLRWRPSKQAAAGCWQHTKLQQRWRRSNQQGSPIRHLATTTTTTTIQARSASRLVHIGDMTVPVTPALTPEAVPHRFSPDMLPPSGAASQEDLATVRWLVQKALLKQDVFLLGPPGPARRRLAMWYAEVTGSEVSTYTTQHQGSTQSSLCTNSLYHIRLSTSLSQETQLTMT